jgi:hypothetical protein
VTIGDEPQGRPEHQAAHESGLVRFLDAPRRGRAGLVLGGVTIVLTAVAAGIAWPGLASAAAAALAALVALTALLASIASRGEQSGERAASGGGPDPDSPSTADVLDQLPFGVLVFERETRRCTYRNRLGARWGAARSEATGAGVPWDPGHLAEVATKLQTGPFTEPLPRDEVSDSPPAEVRWDAFGGRLLATVRDLSDEEEQRMVLDELHLDEVAEGGEPPQRVAVEALCWEVAESSAGDRRPLGVEVETPGAVVFGDPELLRAAIAQLVARATGRGNDTAPVTLRVVTEHRSILVQVDAPEDEPSDAPATESRDELGLARRLAAVHGGGLQIQHLGTVLRTQLDLPRALPQER